MRRQFLLIASVVLTFLLSICLGGPVAWAWKPYNLGTDGCPDSGASFYYRFIDDKGQDGIPSVEVRLAPGVSNPAEGDPVTWTAHQQDVIATALGSFNHIKSLRLHVRLSATPCTADDFAGVGRICLWQKKTLSGSGGQATNELTDACRIRRCKINVSSWGAQYDDALFHVVVHEVGHCLGLDDVDDMNDVMDASYCGPGGFGSDKEHLGHTRDFISGLSYLYPIGPSVFLGRFDNRTSISYDNPLSTDMLIRNAKRTDNTIDWYLQTPTYWYAPGFTSYVDVGEVSDDGDFGDADTLAYLVGNYDGVGLDDIAAGLCIGCDPGDGAADNIRWYVMTGDTAQTNAVGFTASSVWKSDFGGGEDYDQYLVGKFNDDNCDDIVLVRNLSNWDCDPMSNNNKCHVRLYMLPSVDTNSDGACDAFGSSTYMDIVVSDRSAPVAWPWVVGNFYTADGEPCEDIAFGEVSQSAPRFMQWKMLRSTCGSFVLDAQPWTGDLGDNGQLLWFGAHVGWASGQTIRKDADDLIRVKVRDSTVEWGVAYSNGSYAFTGWQTTVADNYLGTYDHYAGKIFGIGKRYRDPSNSPLARDQVVYMAVHDPAGGDSQLYVKDCGVSILGFDSSFATYCQSYDDRLPSVKAVWDQPTDCYDYDTNVDNAGDDVKERWWCPTCSLWYNQTQ